MTATAHSDAHLAVEIPSQYAESSALRRITRLPVEQGDLGQRCESTCHPIDRESRQVLPQRMVEHRVALQHAAGEKELRVERLLAGGGDVRPQREQLDTALLADAAPSRPVP